MMKSLENAFSCRGSWLTVVPRPEGLLIKTIRAQVLSLKGHEEWASDYYRIALLRDGEEIAYTAEADDLTLVLRADDDRATLRFLDSQTLHLTASGVDVKLLPFQDNAWVQHPSAEELILCPQRARLMHHFRVGGGASLEF